MGGQNCCLLHALSHLFSHYQLTYIIVIPLSAWACPAHAEGIEHMAQSMNGLMPRCESHHLQNKPLPR